MSNGKEGLPEVTGARLVAAFAYTFAARADYDAAFDAAEAWLEAQKAEATNPLERMVQELANENARLMQELALAEARMQTELAGTEGRIVALQEEAWARGYRKHAVFGPGYSAANPYRAGGDAK